MKALGSVGVCDTYKGLVPSVINQLVSILCPTASHDGCAISARRTYARSSSKVPIRTKLWKPYTTLFFFLSNTHIGGLNHGGSHIQNNHPALKEDPVHTPQTLPTATCSVLWPAVVGSLVMLRGGLNQFN